MRKGIKVIFLIMICSFLCANKVKADNTNYSEGTIFKNNRECTGNYCIVGNNTNYIIIQARLNYLKISNFENIGKTYYFVNTNAYNYLKSYDLNLIEISQFNSYSGENRYQNAINYLTNNYLNNETNGKEMLNKLTGFNDYTSVLIKDIKRDSESTQGYRILLEPSLVISNVKNGNNTALLTGKGIASLDSTKLSSKLGTYYNQMIKIFDSNTSDSNTYLFNGSLDKCKGYNNQTLSDYKVKCLYKMYNVDDYINKDGNYTCYKKTIEGTKLQCDSGKYLYNDKCYSSVASQVSISENYKCFNGTTMKKTDNKYVCLNNGYYISRIVNGSSVCGLQCNSNGKCENLPCAIKNITATYSCPSGTISYNNLCLINPTEPKKVPNDLTCTNWDKNNEETYEEKYTQVNSCNSYEDRKNMNIYGKSQIFNDIGSCRLYCKEKLEVSLPGNISIPEQKGTYFAWPTTTDGSQYKMQIKTTMDCNIVDDGGAKTAAATMTRTCSAATTNHPTDPDKCISKQTYDKVCNPKTQYTINGKCYYKVVANTCNNDKKTTSRVDIDGDGYAECYNLKDVTTCSNGKIIEGRCYKYKDVTRCANGYEKIKDSDGHYKCFKLEDTKCPGNTKEVNGKCHKLEVAKNDQPRECDTNAGYIYVDSACWLFGNPKTTSTEEIDATCSSSQKCDYKYWKYVLDGNPSTVNCYYKTPQGALVFNKTKCSTNSAICKVAHPNAGATYIDGRSATCYLEKDGLTSTATNCVHGCYYKYYYTKCSPSTTNCSCPDSSYTRNGNKCTRTVNVAPYCYTVGDGDNTIHKSNEIHTNRAGVSVSHLLTGKCNINSYPGTCPNGTEGSFSSGNITVYNCNNVCTNGTYDAVLKKCVTNTTASKTDCSSDYTLNDAPSGKCRYVNFTTDASKVVCPQNTTYDPGKGLCREKSYREGTCDKNYIYDPTSGKCRTNYTTSCNSGYELKGKNKADLKDGYCKSIESTTEGMICPQDGKNYYTSSATSPVCQIISTKPNATSNCPEGYIKNGNTCINPCTSEVKEKYLSRMKEKLKNPKFEAYLKVNDSDRKINDKLEIYNIGTVKEINISRNNNELKEFKLEVTYNVKMNENINRFYNKLTNEVSDINKAGYYDRGEGVISLKRTINTFGLNNTINNYRLEINNFKNVGTDTTFDNLLNSNAYVCQYRITDKSNCKCPIGTKNEGNSVYNISAYINEKNPKVESSNTDVTNSCVELQEQYCNYDIEQEYCKKDNGEKVDITDCIKNTNTTYEEAYNICEKEKCNPSNNYCTKNCTYIDKKINNTVYTIQKCNNNTEICGFYLHCIDEKETSQSYLDLVSQRLNTTNIVKSLRDGLNIDNIESAIRGLDSSICGIKRQPKVVYREIDLNNPFPGKDGKNREAGYNWKSETIINKKITNNRGVKTNQIYNKEPIYTITLTPQIINKIRDYNENNKYNTLLKCNGSVCISDFIHGNSYSLKSMGILSGISNCTNLNTSSTLSSFDSCYNSNN